MMRTRTLALVLDGLLLAAGCLLVGLVWIQNARAQPPSEIQAIGKILSTTGSVTVEHTGAVVVQANAPSGDRPQPKVGDRVYRGDVIQTGTDGNVGLVFTDGTSFSISSN